MIEHIPGMKNHIRIMELLVKSCLPCALMAMRIADNANFHLLSAS
jgi:hypothetical protein